MYGRHHASRGACASASSRISTCKISLPQPIEQAKSKGFFLELISLTDRSKLDACTIYSQLTGLAAEALLSFVIGVIFLVSP